MLIDFETRTLCLLNNNCISHLYDFSMLTEKFISNMSKSVTCYNVILMTVFLSTPCTLYEWLFWGKCPLNLTVWGFSRRQTLLAWCWQRSASDTNVQVGDRAQLSVDGSPSKSIDLVDERVWPVHRDDKTWIRQLIGNLHVLIKVFRSGSVVKWVC